MSTPDDFLVQLQSAIEEKTSNVETVELPKLLENYRLLYTCVKNMFDILVKRGLIIPDPYKLDNKITSIKAPESDLFNESDSAKIIGMRFSAYESTLDFLCTYYKFSLEHISLGEIKKLNELNSSFQWDSFTTNSAKINTRTLATLLGEARKQSDAITLSNINDALDKSRQAMMAINTTLRDITDFVREKYKFEIRQKIIASGKFNSEKAFTSTLAEITEIKRLYAEIIGKKPFYGDLITEIANEDQSDSKEQLRQSVLQKLAARTQPQQSKKKQVDTKEMIFEAAQIIAGAAPQYEQVVQKILDNNAALNAKKNTFGEKVKEFFRKMFNIKPKQIDYTLLLVDPATKAKKTKKIEFNGFVKNLQKRFQLYNAIATQQSAEYTKLKSAPETTILTFVERQISENQELLLLLTALDDFFKAGATAENRPNIKGIKMELVTLKNCVIKTNQKRADYVAHIEEIAQMKRLGIDDE